MLQALKSHGSKQWLCRSDSGASTGENQALQIAACCKLQEDPAPTVQKTKQASMRAEPWEGMGTQDPMHCIV